jgi:hypothetical protein
MFFILISFKTVQNYKKLLKTGRCILLIMYNFYNYNGYIYNLFTNFAIV